MKRLFFLFACLLLLSHSVLAVEPSQWDDAVVVDASAATEETLFVGDDAAYVYPETISAEDDFFTGEPYDFLSEGDALTWDEGDFSSELIGAPPFHNAKAGDIIDQGSYSGQLTWKLIILEDTDPDNPYWSEYSYELVISGTGKMQDFTDPGNDWPEDNYVRKEYSDQIKKLTFSPGITHIGNYAFDAFWNLKEVTIPSTVTSIGRGAFGNTGLVTLSLPASLTSLGFNAFASKSLEVINYPGSDRQLASLFTDGAYHDAISNWFEDYSDGCDYYQKLIWLTGACPWYEIHGKPKTGDILEEGTLPTGVTYQVVVDDPAHWQQPFDSEEDDDGTGIRKIYNAILTFSGKGSIPDYVLKEDEEYQYKKEELPPWKRKSPQNLTDLSAHVTKIVIGDGVTKVGNFAFCHMDNLEEVVLGPSVTSIGYGAFLHCVSSNEQGKAVSGLQKVTLPASLQTIREAAFRDNHFLTTIDSPFTPRELAGLVSLGDDRDVYLWWTGKLTYIFDGGADGCLWMKENCVIKKGLVIDDGTCGSGLTWQLIVDDPQGINGYDENHDDTWDGHYSAPSLELIISGTGAMDDYIEDGENSKPAPWSWRFKYTQNITKITLQKGITHIGNYAFQRLPNLSTVVLADTLESIGAFAFRECSIWRDNKPIRSLENISLPASLTFIGSGAFTGNHYLSTVNYPGSLKKLASLCQGEEGNDRGRLSRVFGEDSIWVRAHLGNIPLEMGKVGYIYAGLSEDTFQQNGVFFFSLASLYSGATAGTYVVRVEINEYGGISLYENNTGVTQPIFQGGNGRQASPAPFECEITLEDGKEYFMIFGVDSGRASKDKVPLSFTITKKEDKPQTVTLGKPSAPAVNTEAASAVISWKAVPSAREYVVYRIEKGKSKKLGKTEGLTFTDKTVKNGGTYTYKVGTVKYTAGSTTYKAGKKSAGTELVFLTAPGKPKVSSTKAKKATVSWAKNAAATGYELRYGTESSMKDAKLLSITKNTTVKKTVKSLKRKTVYYFQVRSYKKVGSKKMVSAWSSVAQVKIK